jgi:hypothetical protein
MVKVVDIHFLISMQGKGGGGAQWAKKANIVRGILKTGVIVKVYVNYFFVIFLI